MERKKILYASPFLPIKSGISDYSETLVHGLRDFFDVTLLTDNYALETECLKKDFEVLIYKKDRIDFDKFEYKIYNIGNQPEYHSYIYECALNHPGVLILHDFILYFLVVGYYSNKDNFYSKLYEIGGPQGLNVLKEYLKLGADLLECKNLASILPLNTEIIRASKLCLVHSNYTAELVRNSFPEEKIHKIDMVNMVCEGAIAQPDYLKNKYGIKDDAFVIGSFGYIAETKQNHLICEAVNELSSNGLKDIYYVMAGEGNYADGYLSENIIKTGYIPRDVYDSILARCNLISNLRCPSMGETSITLIHAMACGKTCLVSDDAWFSELPDEIVVKIKKDEVKSILKDTILHFYHNRNEITARGPAIKKYVDENHSTRRIAEQIYELLASFRKQR